MTARRVLPVVAAFALLTASTARAQDPPAPVEQPQAAAPRAERARSERADGETRSVRSPKRAEAAGSDSQAVQPRVRAVVPDSTAANAGTAADAEEQGGARRRPSGGGSVGGGGSVSGGRSGRGGGGDVGAVRTRPGGVRNPGVDGGTSRAQAIPRSQAPRPPHSVYVAPGYGYGYGYGRRYYYGPTGLGYYFYDPWSWYGYGGWGGYYGSTWGAYYGVGPGYYGSVFPGYYGAGYGGGYGGVYAGPSGWSIGSVRLKVEPRDAEVYVDGYYAGIVDDFDGIWQQLRLDDGGHRIEVRKPGLTTLTFDVMVQPGRTITYRGDMRVIP